MKDSQRARLVARIHGILHQSGAWLYRARASRSSRARGAPDVVGCIEGHHFAIIVQSEELSAAQHRELRSVRQAGGLSYVVRDEDQAYLLCELLDLLDLPGDMRRKIWADLKEFHA